MLLNLFDVSFFVALKPKKTERAMQKKAKMSYASKLAKRICDKQKTLTDEIQYLTKILTMQSEKIDEQSLIISQLRHKISMLESMPSKQDAVLDAEALAKGSRDDNDEVIRLRIALNGMNELFAKEYKTIH